MQAVITPTCSRQAVVVGVRHTARQVCHIGLRDYGGRRSYQDSRREPLSVHILPAAAVAESMTESVERLVVTPVVRADPWDPNRLQQQELRPEACILLISESDVCRSVLAAACLRQMLQEAGMEGLVRVDTCGTRPYNLGEQPEPAAAAALAALGLPPPASHAARLFEPAYDIVSYDLLLTMDKFTAGDVMREVSSFDLVNRNAQFAYKVRRLGEFLGGPSATGAAARYGSEGDNLDIEDPLYGNVGGEEEERAVLRCARATLQACHGLVAFLREAQEEARGAGSPQEGHGGGAEVGHGAEDDEEMACELPLPGQAPVCYSMSSPSDESGADEEDARPPLGPALRARVQTMGPTPWLVPPMLTPRGKSPQF